MGPQVKTSTAGKLTEIIAELSEEFVERETTITNGVLALLARQHHMVVGPIGAAKSAVHEAIVSRIDGANFFATQMHDAMKTDELFGQIDMPTYDREGRWVRNTTGYLPDAHLAMIDEIDKGQHLLRSLLRVANERKWRNGDAEVDLPLITMVASANAALGENLAPVWDRFLLRETVSYIEEAGSFMAMLAGEGKAADPTTVTLAELQQASTLAVPSITVGKEIFEALFETRSDLQNKGVIASDRRWKDSVRLLQARAFLAGRTAVSLADLVVLRHVLWTTTEQVDTVASVLIPHIAPDARKLSTILDTLHSMYQQLTMLEGQSRSARTSAVSDLAEKLSRTRADLATLHEEDVEHDAVRAQRLWVRTKAKMNEVCVGLPADKARERAQTAWTTGS